MTVRRQISLLTLTRYQTEIHSLLGQVLELGAPRGQGGGWEPPIDVVETAERVLLLIELPGIDAEDLGLQIDGQTVTLQGKKPPPQLCRSTAPASRSSDEPEDLKVRSLECEHGTFERRVELLPPVNAQEGRARLADGLLVVEFPKILHPRRRPRRIAIEADPRPEPAP